MSNYSVFNLRTMETYTPSVHGQGVVIQSVPIALLRHQVQSVKGKGASLAVKQKKIYAITKSYYRAPRFNSR